MKVLIIGSGGREHALALKLKESKKLTQLYTAPGNAGTAQLGTNVAIPDTDISQLADFAQSNQIDITIVGPEAPLTLGVVDEFRRRNLKIVGPDKVGAQLEGSKKWAKALMTKYGIPTADYRDFTTYESAAAYVKSKNQFPIVVKADGLAAGKGVTVAQSIEEADQALRDCFLNKKFKDAGTTVVIESFLQGEEASIFAFCDGQSILPMSPAQDHKTIYNDDKGPNTGGMGSYCPAPLVTPEIEQKVYEQVFLPLLNGFKAEGIDYRGIVYAGLMIHNNDVSIVEFNVRFGDPETQVVLPRLKTDLLEIFDAIADQRLASISLEWKENFAVCVVLASDGYPGDYEKLKPISGLELLADMAKVNVVHAGTAQNSEQQLVTNGGRVMAVVGMDDTLEDAIKATYKGVHKVKFSGKYYRTDIGAKALKRLKMARI